MNVLWNKIKEIHNLIFQIHILIPFAHDQFL